MLDLNDDAGHDSALSRAYLLGLSSKKFGLDWEDISQVIYKVEEEWQELKEEIKPGISPDQEKQQKKQQERQQEEIGDLLFSIAQLSRHLGLDPEEALVLANKKFMKRVRKVNDLIQEEGAEWKELSFEQLDEYWERAKLL